MAHYTGNSEIILYGKRVISDSTEIIELGSSQIFYTPSNAVFYHDEGADNIAIDWEATEEDP